MVTRYPGRFYDAVSVPRCHVGDIVRWESQSAGTWSTHEGRVVAVIPADARFRLDMIPLALGNCVLCFDVPDTTRDHVSYLVEVPHPGRGKPRLYWPRVPTLERVAERRAA